ncbi:TlpA disulfide reductase family protein [Pedobacter aquatilis]|uniref:TlpA family protein disulfide reductase n=1 Tax=Pedobacter aquatilis TaxID=351343 RepID=UPI00292DFA44|nr:TlpA disulfide reductase family protein [Pedobacter aquatilis]
MTKYSLFILSLCCLTAAHAQQQTAEIFKATAAKIKTLKSISYKVQFTDKNPFSKDDIATGKSTASILFNQDGTVKYKREKTNINDGQTVYQSIYKTGRLYGLSLPDSTYTDEEPKEKVTTDITAFTTLLIDNLNKNPQKIIRKADTVFRNKRCFNFLIKLYDSLLNGNHDYTYKQILIEQKTMLPAYLKETGAGMTYKEGLPLGRLIFFNEKSFSDIKINQKVAVLPLETTGFTKPNTQMLDIGAKAPALVIKDLSGGIPDVKIGNKKLLLIIFGATDCPANPLANPMVNRIYTKYATDNFAIVNIYTNETTDQVKKYIEANNIKFPVYTASRKLGKEFKTAGTPNFYLIDKNGIVVSKSKGYAESLEERFTKEIDKLLGK